MHADFPLARVREYFYGYVKKFKGLRSLPDPRGGPKCPENHNRYSERLEKAQQRLLLNGREFAKFPGHVLRLALVTLDGVL
jgi:hypothetical protein